jgi:hypothetical protein
MNEKLENAKARLVEIQKKHDTEKNHIEADNVLCDLLRELGYDEVVNEYREIEKWFA